MPRYKSSFEKWLHQPEPKWKVNIELCNDFLYHEIGMSKDELLKLMEKLEEYEIFKGYEK